MEDSGDEREVGPQFLEGLRGVHCEHLVPFGSGGTDRYSTVVIKDDVGVALLLELSRPLEGDFLVRGDNP